MARSSSFRNLCCRRILKRKPFTVEVWVLNPMIEKAETVVLAEKARAASWTDLHCTVRFPKPPAR